MPDEITRVDYYMGAVPNKVGEGARVLNAFKEAGVNLTGFLGYPKTARNAELVLIVGEKTPNPGPVARKAGLKLGKKQKAFFINGEDRPGAVAEKMALLAEAGVNVVSCHALCAGAGRYGALVAVGGADLRKAAKTLGLG